MNGKSLRRQRIKQKRIQRILRGGLTRTPPNVKWGKITYHEVMEAAELE